MLSNLSSEAIRDIFLALPIATCVLDRDTCYLAASHKYSALLDMPLSALRGKTMIDFCPPEIVANARQSFATFDRGALVADHEIVFRNNAYLVSVNPVYHGNSAELTAIAVALTDISHLKKLEADLARTNGRLREALNRIKASAETDTLTGLLNRRGLESVLTKEIWRARRERQPIALAIVDVDWFKLYNDSYGHLIGDAGLKAVARAVKSAIRRPGDWVARFGGEEFIVVLPNTDIDGARHVCVNVADAVANLDIAHSMSAFGRLTVSVGVSAVPVVRRAETADMIYEQLLHEADKALYAAKAAGRNAVIAYADLSGSPSS